MKKQTNFIPVGHPNRPGTKLESVKAIVVHYTENAATSMGALANIRWWNRKYETKGGKFYEVGGEKLFRYGSAHVVCDADGVVLAVPTNEVAWAVGDKNFDGGFQEIAQRVFRGRQNMNSISVEICNNNPPENWPKAVENAKRWIVEHLSIFGLEIDVAGSLAPQQVTSVAEGKVLLLRHYDITGKICPKPFVENGGAWMEFIQDVAGRLEAA